MACPAPRPVLRPGRPPRRPGRWWPAGWPRHGRDARPGERRAPVRMRASVVGSRLEVASSSSSTLRPAEQGPGQGARVGVARLTGSRPARRRSSPRRRAARQQERVDLGQVEGALQVLVARPSPWTSMFSAQRVGEQEGLLEDERGGGAWPPRPSPRRARTDRPARPAAWTCPTPVGPTMATVVPAGDVADRHREARRVRVRSANVTSRGHDAQSSRHRPGRPRAPARCDGCRHAGCPASGPSRPASGAGRRGRTR